MLKPLKSLKIQTLSLNFGPQHPAAHGVLRLVLSLKNERIVTCDPHIGLLHRGTESLVCSKPYYLSLPYFDRLDYVSMLNQEHGYCLAIEKLLPSSRLPNLVLKTRVILDEITRIMNHLLAVACHALDVGSMSPLFWAFEEREVIMEIYEYTSGARMHAAFYRPVYNNKILTAAAVKKTLEFLKSCPSTLNEIQSTLTLNKVWKSRLCGVGITSRSDIKSFALSGVFARSAGMRYDLRLFKKSRYSYYSKLNLFSFVANSGDAYARFNLRMFEMLESSNIASNVLVSYNSFKNINLVCSTHRNMEGTVDAFKLWSGSTTLPLATAQASLESPKGTFSVFVVGDGTSVPFRCKVRSPSYNNLLWLKSASKGTLLADLITLIGTVDIVFGEVDR